jgi:CubicO group peptidase (beta-lactamase class C family)
MLAALFAAPAHAEGLPADTARAVDAIVAKALSGSVTPSVSIAIVKDGKLAYAQAYGAAQLAPEMTATPAMRYKIASNSKQITAAAILLLAEEHKLALDDKVARFFPKLTRAKDVSLRQLLSHTSGYQDYYAIDYLPPGMQRDTTAQAILDTYAMKPLDFEPGTLWQYSNTNYLILGKIVEKVSGQTLSAFLRKRIFNKLGMDSAIDVTDEALAPSDAHGYTHYALGPVRPVAPEGKGWMWAMGELAMTASDLAKWDIALMDGTILRPASLKALGTATSLSNGASSGYGLGVSVSMLENGHRRWRHTGGASGFLSINTTYPDDRMAITVLSNGEGTAQREIAASIEELLLTKGADAGYETSLAHTRQLLASLQTGVVDRAMLTDDLSGYFSSAVLADFGASLSPLGQVDTIEQTQFEDRGGMAYRVYTVKMANKTTLKIAAYIKADGRFDQYLVSKTGG